MASPEKKKKTKQKKKGTKDKDKGPLQSKLVATPSPPMQINFSGKPAEKETFVFTLRNTTDKEIWAFKIKPNNPKMFTAEPDIGLINGGVTQSIKLTRMPFDPNTYDHEDKVLIMNHRAPDGVLNAKQAWGRITEQPFHIRILISLPELRLKEPEPVEEEEEE